MSTLESLLHDATTRLEVLRAELREAEARAQGCLIEAEKAAAYVEGLRAAQAISAVPRVRVRAPEEQGARNRDLTNVWKLILRTVSNKGSPFDYDDLDKASRLVGHESSRETLRSQMSLYKGRNLVASAGSGAFTLTSDGIDAIAGAKMPAPEPARKPAFGGGAFSDDLDDDVPF